MMKLQQGSSWGQETVLAYSTIVMPKMQVADTFQHLKIQTKIDKVQPR